MMEEIRKRIREEIDRISQILPEVKPHTPEYEELVNRLGHLLSIYDMFLPKMEPKRVPYVEKMDRMELDSNTRG